MAISASQRRDDDDASSASQRLPDMGDASEADDLSATPAALAQASETLDLSALQAALHPALEDFPRVPRQARSREKRDALLACAETLFVERGYAATTADDIARAAGVSVGAFYNYFRNKRQILLTLALRRLSDIFTQLRLAQLDLAHGDPHAGIRDAIASVVADGGRPGLRAVWQQLMSLEPELAPYQATVRRYALNLIEERLRAARDGGDLWPDLDIEGTAFALFALLDSLSSRRDDDLPEERVIASVTALIERALFPAGKLGGRSGATHAAAAAEGSAPDESHESHEPED